MKPLPPPDDVMTHADAVEVLRGWVVDGDLQVSLAFEAFGDRTELWGQLLAEVAVHLADALSGEGYGERAGIFAKIRDSLLENLDSPHPGLTGTTKPPVQ
jgi:Domain of unknown function (DUF5076)